MTGVYLLAQAEAITSALLELPKLKQYKALQYTPSRNRQWHMYAAVERPDARSYPLRRLFARGTVRQLGHPALLAASYSGNGAAVAAAAVAELEEGLVRGGAPNSLQPPRVVWREAMALIFHPIPVPVLLRLSVWRSSRDFKPPPPPRWTPLGTPSRAARTGPMSSSPCCRHCPPCTEHPPSLHPALSMQQLQRSRMRRVWAPPPPLRPQTAA